MPQPSELFEQKRMVREQPDGLHVIEPWIWDGMGIFGRLSLGKETVPEAFFCFFLPLFCWSFQDIGELFFTFCFHVFKFSLFLTFDCVGLYFQLRVFFGCCYWVASQVLPFVCLPTAVWQGPCVCAERAGLRVSQ